MKVKQISRRNLPHVATYKAYTGNSGDADTYDTPKELKYVKIENRQQLKTNNNIREVVGNLLMFYDYVNSEGLTSIPINNSIVNFNGIDYHVIDTEVLYADLNIPHHYEVMLK